MDVKDELFRLTREHDAHEINYYLNSDKQGRLDQSEPVEAYWIRYEFDGSTTGRPLNALESKYAYGVKFYDVTEKSARFQFVSYQRDLFLERTANEFEVLVEIRGKEVRLERVHLSIGKGSFWVPTISRIELHAVDPETGKAVVEVINNP